MALTEKEWVGRPVIPLADGQSALEEVPRLVPRRRAGLRMVERGIRIVEGMPSPWVGEPLLGGIVNNGSLDLPLGLEGNEGVLVAPVVQARNWHLRREIEQARLAAKALIGAALDEESARAVMAIWPEL